MVEFMGTFEASQLWGYSQSTITEWCREGKIPGAMQDFYGSSWHIPKDAECPRSVKERKIKH